MKRKSNSQSIGEVLNQFLKENHLDEKLVQQSVVDAWKDIAGQIIKNHTRNIYFSNRQLIVELDSDVLRHEVSMQKTRLIQNVNQYAQYELIQTLIIK